MPDKDKDTDVQQSGLNLSPDDLVDLGIIQPPAVQAPEVGPPALGQQPSAQKPQQSSMVKADEKPQADELAGMAPPAMPTMAPSAAAPRMVTAPEELPSSVLGDKVKPGAMIPPEMMHQAGKLAYYAERPPITAAPGTEDKYLQRIQQMDYDQQHPWGSMVSAHPGVMGKILHGLAMAGNIAGDVLAPNTMALIPGTQLFKERERAQEVAQANQSVENRLKTAQTISALRPPIGKTPDEVAMDAATKKYMAQIDPATGKPYTQEGAALRAWKDVKAGDQTPGKGVDEQEFASKVAQFKTQTNPKTGKPYTDQEAADQAYQDIQDIKAGSKGPTQEENKRAFQTVIGKLDSAHLPTDPKHLDKSLDEGLKKGVITADEHQTVRGYQSANSTPATNLTVHIAGQDEAAANAINKIFEGKEVVAYMPDGRRVQMSYADAQAQGIPHERLVALNGKEAQDNRDKHASTEATFAGLNTYRTDFKATAPNLTTADRDAMRVLTSHQKDGTTANVLGGLIDDLPLAGPLGSYVNKMLEGTMTSDQYNQMSPAGKKLVSDYFTAVLGNFANMKAIMGSVGRNPMQLQAEINTVPPPYLDWESASDAFDNKRNDLMHRASSMPELYKPGNK